MPYQAALMCKMILTVLQLQKIKTCWNNGGRGGDTAPVKTKVVQTRAYKEWLFDFVPNDKIYKCGISFYVNGVCHTYANRKLLLGEGNVDVRDAPKDYVCVVFFGKYGFGLNQLKRFSQITWCKSAAKPCKY